MIENARPLDIAQHQGRLPGYPARPASLGDGDEIRPFARAEHSDPKFMFDTHPPFLQAHRAAPQAGTSPWGPTGRAALKSAGSGDPLERPCKPKSEARNPKPIRNPMEPGVGSEAAAGSRDNPPCPQPQPARSKAQEQFVRAHSQRLRNAKQNPDTGAALTPLNPAHIIWVDIRLLSKRLLAQARSPATPQNRIANDFPFRFGHYGYGNRNRKNSPHTPSAENA